MAHRLFHSFPRMGSRDSTTIIGKGCDVLRSIFDIGLLLVPERVTFPIILDSGPDYDRGTHVYQLRCCFTLLEEGELHDHSLRFGPFAIEFDVDILRLIGAFPVIYVPQPVRWGDKFAELSVIGNNFVHQIRDISVLLRELILLEQEANRAEDPTAIHQVHTLRRKGAISAHSVALVTDYLLGSKRSFQNLLDCTELMANMFYHSDSARADLNIEQDDLRYYSQREWRIVAGITMNDVPFDRELAVSEQQNLVRTFEFFKAPVVLKDGVQRPRAMISRAISEVRGKPFWKSIRTIHVPDVVVDKLREEFASRGVPKALFTPVRYGA